MRNSPKIYSHYNNQRETWSRWSFSPVTSTIVLLWTNINRAKQKLWFPNLHGFQQRSNKSTVYHIKLCQLLAYVVTVHYFFYVRLEHLAIECCRLKRKNKSVADFSPLVQSVLRSTSARSSAIDWDQIYLHCTHFTLDRPQNCVWGVRSSVNCRACRCKLKLCRQSCNASLPQVWFIDDCNGHGERAPIIEHLSNFYWTWMKNFYYTCINHSKK